MKIFEVIQEEPLDVTDVGMGLSQYYNSNFVLWGGMRSGNSPAGYTRLKFMVFDRKLLDAGAEQEDAEIGYVELFVKDGTHEIDGIVNIELNKDIRKTGYGKQLIKDIVDTSKSGITVNDIQKRAKGFWKKQGVQFTDKAERFGRLNKE